MSVAAIPGLVRKIYGRQALVRSAAPMKMGPSPPSLQLFLKGEMRENRAILVDIDTLETGTQSPFMKFTLTYSLHEFPDIQNHTVLHDEFLTSSDLERRIVSIAKSASLLTMGGVSLTCSELGLKNLMISAPSEQNPERIYYIFDLCLLFENRVHVFTGKHFKMLTHIFQVGYPVKKPFPGMTRDYGPLANSVLTFTQARPATPYQEAYINALHLLVDDLTFLLNWNNPQEGEWYFRGFNPRFENGQRRRAAARKAKDNQHKTQLEEKRRLREERMQEKRAAYIQEHQARSADGTAPEPKTGSGRTVGARPGKYKNVQMRSQLEIRFAAELDERGYRWIYEGEALGDAGYLVDFYLPDLGVWVEVKGSIDARDRQVLPEVARTLKAARGHRLMMYTQSGSCYVINPSGYREVKRRDFWTELIR